MLIVEHSHKMVEDVLLDLGALEPLPQIGIDDRFMFAVIDLALVDDLAPETWFLSKWSSLPYAKGMPGLSVISSVGGHNG